MIVLGALITIDGLASLGRCPASVYSEAIQVVLGALMFVSPWVMSYTEFGPISWVSSWITGALTVARRAPRRPARPGRPPRGMAGQHYGRPRPPARSMRSPTRVTLWATLLWRRVVQMARDHVMSDDPSARERILAAAEELFAETGFDATPTSRIAARAPRAEGPGALLLPSASRTC